MTPKERHIKEIEKAKRNIELAQKKFDYHSRKFDRIVKEIMEFF